MYKLSNDLHLRKRLPCAMIGGGHGAFFAAYHRSALRLSNRWILVAGAFSSNPEKSRRSGCDFGLEPERIYDDAESLAAGEAAREDGARTVIVVTPNKYHYGQCKAALLNGLNVICDKPLVNSLSEADELAALAKANNLFFGVTFTYPGYPMVREARSRIARGDLGRITFAYAEYLQEWVADRPENIGEKGGAWRGDPAIAGPTGTASDVGTHAQSVLEFLLDEPLALISADLSSSTGRAIDDRAIVQLEFLSGVKGLIWADQALPGHRNGLRIKVGGEKATLEWRQEAPETLWIGSIGQPDQILHRGQTCMTEPGFSYVTLPAGVPEGYMEALSILYSDFADVLEGEAGNLPYPPLDISYGMRGVAFAEAALTSSRSRGQWTSLR